MIKSIIQLNKNNVDLTLANFSQISKDLSDVSSSLNDGNLDNTLSNFKNSSDDLSKDIN